MLRKFARAAVGWFGYEISYKSKLTDPSFEAIYERCRRYTLTSRERMYGLFQAVEYAVKAGIPGDFVECGVWLGGSSMNIALNLLRLQVTDRSIILYETFHGMSEPTSADVDLFERTARKGLSLQSKGKYSAPLSFLSHTQKHDNYFHFILFPSLYDFPPILRIQAQQKFTFKFILVLKTKNYRFVAKAENIRLDPKKV